MYKDRRCKSHCRIRQNLPCLRGAVLAGPCPVYFWPENGANKVVNGGGNVLNGVTSLGYVDRLDLELLEGVLFATHDPKCCQPFKSCDAVSQSLTVSFGKSCRHYS